MVVTWPSNKWWQRRIRPWIFTRVKASSNLKKTIKNRKMSIRRLIRIGRNSQTFRIPRLSRNLIIKGAQVSRRMNLISILRLARRQILSLNRRRWDISFRIQMSQSLAQKLIVLTERSTKETRKKETMMLKRSKYRLIIRCGHRNYHLRLLWKRAQSSRQTKRKRSPLRSLNNRKKSIKKLPHSLLQMVWRTILLRNLNSLHKVNNEAPQKRTRRVAPANETHLKRRQVSPRSVDRCSPGRSQTWVSKTGSSTRQINIWRN